MKRTKIAIGLLILAVLVKWIRQGGYKFVHCMLIWSATLAANW